MGCANAESTFRPPRKRACLCLQQTRVIFTEDDDFLILHSQGMSHAGITYCEQNSRSIGQIIRGLELIWQVLEPDEMFNRIEFI